ncbi:VOC family protein [Streptomyces somaliensis DSM 40738]|uniref:VOC family protein n=1 Tax=Streptomyces somaliensis (strain ATCC 33201 / DSM 40738 / JCM 12659 / KCTC 9044 / NCTC 11332 / NRRL B-12077 / IP 733) TaxID=1134445 RepID=A0AA44IF57_STRE0|nr:VOC family protein [Streptomyces somaliensis]MCQ0024633.1 VOC family protein [Streptomyces somaliensis DSM 40738]NKY16465.1 VOC family protein [Streptomyces somaliensis DSM 40738]
MAGPPEGTPVWADAMFTDLEGARAFYGEVLGWTFREEVTEHGGRVRAYAGGGAAAALVPPVPGRCGGAPQSAWCLHFASPDVEAVARRVRESGGRVVAGPAAPGEPGPALLAHGPDGAVFGVRRPDARPCFEARGVPGAYRWAEVNTREAARTDAFFRTVFPFAVERPAGSGPDPDLAVFRVGETPVLGRRRMGEGFPPEMRPFVGVHFAVDDVDAAIGRATAHGGKVVSGPAEGPFGRFATLVDPQGAVFSLVGAVGAED